MGIEAVAGISRKQPQLRVVLVFDLVDHAHMGVHQRRQFGQQQPADGGEITVTLHHVGEFGEVGLQPVLLGIDVGGEPEVADHGVDIVFELGHFAARIDLDGAGEVALRDRRRHLGDGAHLGRQICRKQVDVAGQILPRARGARHVCLAAQPAFHADFTRDRGHLIGERRQRLCHVVDGFGESGHLALRLHGKVLREIAVRDRRHDLHDAANLIGKICSHDIHGIRKVFPCSRNTRHVRLPS